MLFRFAKRFFKKNAQSCLIVDNSPCERLKHAVDLPGIGLHDGSDRGHWCAVKIWQVEI